MTDKEYDFSCAICECDKYGNTIDDEFGRPIVDRFIGNFHGTLSAIEDIARHMVIESGYAFVAQKTDGECVEYFIMKW